MREEILTLTDDDLYTLANARRLLMHFMAARQPTTFAELLEEFVGEDYRGVYRELPRALLELHDRLEGMLPIDRYSEHEQSRQAQDAILRLYGDHINYTVDQLRHSRLVED